MTSANRSQRTQKCEHPLSPPFFTRPSVTIPATLLYLCPAVYIYVHPSFQNALSHASYTHSHSVLTSTTTHSDIRSVTVWFQNKRQTDRRIHRQLSEPTVQLSRSHLHSHSHSHPFTPSSPMPLPPSSPFSDASGNTIHTARIRERTRTLSATAATSRTRDRDQDHDREHDASHALARHVRHKSGPARTISLDDIAARAERPALLPRTPPQLPCIPSSSSPARPQTPDPAEQKDKDKDKDKARDGKMALWQNMPSSPAGPEPATRSERELVRYGYGSRRLTLEYACAREMMGDQEREVERVVHRHRVRGEKDTKEKKHQHQHRKEQGQHGQRKAKRRVGGGGTQPQPVPQPVVPTVQKLEDDDLDIPVAEWDAHGDTDTEGVLSEAPVTPSSTFDFGELSMQDPVSKANVPTEARKAEAVPVQVQSPEPGRDDDMLVAAYLLCHFKRLG